MVFARGRGPQPKTGPSFVDGSPSPTTTTTSTIRLDPDVSPKIGLHIRSDTNLTLPKPKRCWSKCILYLHITILYVLLIVLYSELKTTKKNIYDFNLAMLNLSAKHMELEMSCFREMSVLREALSGSREAARNKRDAPNKWELDGDGLNNRQVKNRSVEREVSELESYGVMVLNNNQFELRNSRRVTVMNGRNRTSRSSPHLQPRRGKQGTKHRSCKRSKAASFVHLRGGLPESVIRDGATGLIAPWFVDKKAAGDFGFMSTQDLKQGKGTIEIGESGLYLLYAQVYYLTSDPLNSFSIMVKEGGLSGGSSETAISTCSTTSVTSGDISCFTSVVRQLNGGDWIYLRQREMNRKLLFRDGQTYFGIVLISRPAPTKLRK